VYLSVTALASATNALKSRSKVPTESTRCGNKINVGLELKILSLKVMTVNSLPWNLHLALTAGNQCQQVTSVVRRLLVMHLHL